MRGISSSLTNTIPGMAQHFVQPGRHSKQIPRSTNSFNIPIFSIVTAQVAASAVPAAYRHMCCKCRGPLKTADAARAVWRSALFDLAAGVEPALEAAEVADVRRSPCPSASCRPAPSGRRRRNRQRPSWRDRRPRRAVADAGSARNSTRPRGMASAPGTLPDAATSAGSRTSRNSTSGRPTSPLASSGLIRGTAASASASIVWTVFISLSRPTYCFDVRRTSIPHRRRSQRYRRLTAA